MEDNGYTVRVKDVQNLAPVKEQHGVPGHLQSCHTAIVDGYVIEGHVPIDALERLLVERPEVAGLAVPGMPIGSPGMESPGAAPEPFDVIAFDLDGNNSVFASYNQ